MTRTLEITYNTVGVCYSACGYYQIYNGYSKTESLRLFKAYLRKKLGVRRLPFKLVERKGFNPFYMTLYYFYDTI